MRAGLVIRIVVVCYAVFCAILPSSLENWHSTRSESELSSASQLKPLPPGSARLCVTFRSLQLMVAIFKDGLRVQQERTAMP